MGAESTNAVESCQLLGTYSWLFPTFGLSLWCVIIKGLRSPDPGFRLPLPPPGVFIAFLALEAVLITVATVALTSPPPMCQRVFWIVFAFAVMLLEVIALYRARDNEERHRRATIEYMETLEDRASDILRSQTLFNESRDKPKASLKSRVLAESAAILALLSRPRAKLTFPDIMYAQSQGKTDILQAFNFETKQIYFDSHAAKVRDLYQEIRRQGLQDDDLEELCDRYIAIEQIRTVAEKLEFLGRQL